MATTSGLNVSPGLGVSVIAWLADVVRGRGMSGVECTLALGGGSWLKNMLGAVCGARSCARLLPFWLPLFESGSGC